MSFGFYSFVSMTPEAVMKPLEKATENHLVTIGANVRQRARTSLKYGRKASSPGQPPTVHRINRRGYSQSFSPVREFILFDVDSSKTEVVIGPKMLSGRTGAVRKLEHGGTVTTKKGKTITIKPRPFMAPAFEAEMMGVAGLWTDSI